MSGIPPAPLPSLLPAAGSRAHLFDAPRFDMRNALVLCAALSICSFPAASWAGLDLTWNACNTDGGDSTRTFDCSNAESYATLIGCFQPPDTLPGFVALAILLEFQPESDELEPFWHFEQGGCNRSGLTTSDAIPARGCAGVLNPWGEEGSESLTATGAYAPGYEAHNRGRMVCSVARSAVEPITLMGGANYFGFQLRFFSHKAKGSGGECPGCRTPLVVVWKAASLEALPPAQGQKALHIVFSGSGLASNCARANGAKRATCAAIPPPHGAADSLEVRQK